MSVTDRLRLRLQQTGKKWTLNQYLYVSGGIFVIAICSAATSGSADDSLWAGTAMFLALALPHFAVSYLIKKRINRFHIKISGSDRTAGSRPEIRSSG
jgi:tight adherence protein B